MRNVRVNRRVVSGFTMVELIAVIVILGLLMGLVARNYMGQTDKARVTTTRANLKMLHEAVVQFKMDTGRYPEEEEGLYALIEQPTDVTNWESGGYLQSTDLPLDGWDREFEYIRYPASGKPFVIKSYGADGEEGGEDYDADLLSTDL